MSSIKPTDLQEQLESVNQDLSSVDISNNSHNKADTVQTQVLQQHQALEQEQEQEQEQKQEEKCYSCEEEYKNYDSESASKSNQDTLITDNTNQQQQQQQQQVNLPRTKRNLAYIPNPSAEEVAMYLRSIPILRKPPRDYSHTWSFYEKLGRPKYVLAPMVDQSELAFRILTRRYGAQLCYTPMINARVYLQSATYREEYFTTDANDRPLFVQLCGDSPTLLLRAAKMLEDKCDAIDLNFGCPQGIAKRGHYGAYLLEEPELVKSIVSTMHQYLKVPITCKIRIFDDADATIRLAKAIQEAGCWILTVHGRTKEMKKDHVGPNNFDLIKRIKQELSIPVFANGGIYDLNDVHRALEYTGADGIMSSEAILGNPALFSGKDIDPIDMAEEYLAIAQSTSTIPAYIQAHLFKILHRHLQYFTHIRDDLGNKKLDLNEVPALVRQAEKEAMANTGKTRQELYAHIPSWYHRHTVFKPSATSKKPRTNVVALAERQDDGLGEFLGMSTENY